MRAYAISSRVFPTPAYTIRCGGRRRRARGTVRPRTPHPGRPRDPKRASAPPDWRWPSGQSTRDAGPGRRPRPAPGNAWSAWHDYRCKPACRPRPRYARPGHPRSKDRRLDVESGASALGFPDQDPRVLQSSWYVANGYHRTPRLSKRKAGARS